MPDKKPTDSEIVKEFQLRTLKAEHPGFILCGQIVDLINRLQDKNKAYKYYYDECLKDLKKSNKEIEKLRYNLEAVLDERADHSEAYKECIEKVKAEINKHSYGVLHKTVINFKLDNLLKEMVGDNQ